MCREIDVGSVSGENRGDDAGPEGTTSGIPGGLDGSVVLVREVDERDGPGDVAQGGEGVGLEAKGCVIRRGEGGYADELGEGRIDEGLENREIVDVAVFFVSVGTCYHLHVGF